MSRFIGLVLDKIVVGGWSPSVIFVALTCLYNLADMYERYPGHNNRAVRIHTLRDTQRTHCCLH